MTTLVTLRFKSFSLSLFWNLQLISEGLLSGSYSVCTIYRPIIYCWLNNNVLNIYFEIKREFSLERIYITSEQNNKQEFNLSFFPDVVLLYFFQDQEWEVVEKPGQSSSPQVSRKDETSSSHGKPPRPARPSSLPSSPAKKKESLSYSPEGTR